MAAASRSATVVSTKGQVILPKTLRAFVTFDRRLVRAAKSLSPPVSEP